MSDERFKKGDWTNCRYDICEIVNANDEVVCIVSLNDADKVIAILEENEYLKKELKELNRKYIAFSEATDKRLKEMMR